MFIMRALAAPEGRPAIVVNNQVYVTNWVHSIDMASARFQFELEMRGVELCRSAIILSIKC